MPKAPELSYINFMPSPKLWLFKFAGVPDYKIPPPPPHYPRRRGVLQTSSDRDDQRIFNSGIFWGIQNNLKFRGQCPRTVRPPSPINCFYFSCYFNAFWKFLRFRNSAWELLEVWFLLPFDHPRHLKSVVSSPGPRKSNTFRFQINQPINLT